MFIVVSPVNKWKKVCYPIKTKRARRGGHVIKLVYKLCFEVLKVLRKKP